MYLAGFYVLGIRANRLVHRLLFAPSIFQRTLLFVLTCLFCCRK